MAEEMILESLGSGSDEAEDWESDDAMADSEDSVEDIGERARRRRRPNNRFRPGRGVPGMTVRDAEGRPRNIPRLATVDETNRGLARQEVARHTLEERLDRLEARTRRQLKNSSTISGAVTLLLGGGLTAVSIFKAQQQTAGGSSLFSNWADQNTAQMATLSSVSQLAATGAKLLVNGRYHYSGVGIAADAFATLQIVGFTLASLQQNSQVTTFTSVVNGDALLKAAMSPGAAVGDQIYQADTQTWFVLSKDFTNGSLIPVPVPHA
jgi:hypothetical protein